MLVSECPKCLSRRPVNPLIHGHFCPKTKTIQKFVQVEEDEVFRDND